MSMTLDSRGNELIKIEEEENDHSFVEMQNPFSETKNQENVSFNSQRKPFV